MPRLVDFLSIDSYCRLKWSIYWVFLLVVSVPFIPKVVERYNISQICSRKIFHLLAVTMFAPVMFYQVDILIISFGVAVCFLILIEIARKLFKDRPMFTGISSYYDYFIDSRDKSKYVALTHIYLLMGCAVPLWIWAVLIMSSENNEAFLNSAWNKTSLIGGHQKEQWLLLNRRTDFSVI